MSLRWIGGTHAVEETLRAKPASARELWVEHELNSPQVKAIIGCAKAAGVRVQFMSRRELDRALQGGRHQGVALKVEEGAGEDLPRFLENLEEADKRGMILVALDQIQDPHNLGAIARSAVNLGARGLVLPERRAAPVTAAAVQASAGAIQKVPVFHVVNLAQALERCKKAGFWVYGADMGGRAAWDLDFNRPLVLVIGSEGRGLRPIVRQACDEIVSVPQAARAVESFNASCAATALLYEIARQGRAQNGEPER